MLWKYVFLTCQGRGVGNGKKKLEAAAAAQEDRDKPYACDSELWPMLFQTIVVLNSHPFKALELLYPHYFKHLSLKTNIEYWLKVWNH